MSEGNLRLYKEFVKECESYGAEPTMETLENKILAEKSRKDYENAVNMWVNEYTKSARKVFSNTSELKTFLDVASRIPFSMSNLLLVYDQMPHATDLKSYDYWVKSHASVKDGAKPVYITEPKKVYHDDNRYSISYDKKAKFDVSQTTGYKVPEKVKCNVETLIRGLIHDSICKIETVRDEKFPKNADGAYYSYAEKIIIAKIGMNEDEIFPKLAKAVAHSYLALGKKEYNPREFDFEADCIVRALCKSYDIINDYVKLPEIPKKIRDAEWTEHKVILTRIVENYKKIKKNMDKFIGEEMVRRRIEERLEKELNNKQKTIFQGDR